MPGNTSMWCGWASINVLANNYLGWPSGVWMPPGGAIPKRGNFALSGVRIDIDSSDLIK
jgi:hypothetical protein